MKKIITLALAMMMLLSVFAISTSAAATGTIYHKVDGVTEKKTDYLTKVTTNEPYYVRLNMNPSGRIRAVLLTRLLNSEGSQRGYCEIYEGTSNTGSNTATKGYIYQLAVKRQYTWDKEVFLFSGVWELR